MVIRSLPPSRSKGCEEIKRNSIKVWYTLSASDLLWVPITQEKTVMTVMAEESSPVAYFNNAAKARFDHDVVSTGIACLQKDPWEMNAEEDQHRVRELFAHIVGASSEQIAIMPSTAFAITLAAHNLKDTVLKNKEGKILLLSDQYPSAVYPWQDICRISSSLSLEIVPYPDETQSWTLLILDRLSKGDILVACLPPLFWCDGSLIDLDKIGAYCKERNIVLIVDATQAAGIYPVNVQTIQPAMLACSVHKWLRGPAGTCLCFIDENVVSQWQPLDQHDRARDWHGQSIAYRNTLTPSGYPADFVAGARKFDAGGRTQPILMPMLRTGMEKVVATIFSNDKDVNSGVYQAQAQLHTLMQPFRDWVATQNATFHPLPSDPATHSSHILGLMPTKLSTDKMLEVATRLAKEKGIIISVRCGMFRIAPYLDNTPGDVASLIEALTTCIQ